MSYIINKTDGSVLTEIVDGTVDQTASDITLIGKNSSSYGEFFNENFVHILENFANTTQPSNPIAGQLWYDTNEGRLKVYDGGGFKVSGGTIVASTVPSSIAQGDIWIDSFRRQLYFNDGVSTMLAGPQYTAQQGISGFQIVDILDINQVSHTVVFLYVSAVLLGIFSKDSFTPATDIAGYTGDIEIGFNQSNYSGIKFATSATSAYNLIDGNGNLKTAGNFIANDSDGSINGTLTLTSSTPLILGTSTQNEILVSNSAFQINSNRSNQNFQIGVKNVNGLKPGLYIDSLNERVGIYTASPGEQLDPSWKGLDVKDNVRIRGNLIVDGSTVTVNTATLDIEDKNITIAKGAADAAAANGAGITVDGANATFNYVSTTEAWTSSENLNIVTGKTYKIGNFPVLSLTSLGSSVASAPGLTSIGTQTNFYAGTINIASNTISSTIPNDNIVLAPNGLGLVSVNDTRIVDLSDPVDNGDAVNYSTLNDRLQSLDLGLSADTTGLVDQQAAIASQIINKVYPAFNYLDGTICRIHCVNGGVRTNKQYSIVAGTWTFNTNI